MTLNANNLKRYKLTFEFLADFEGSEEAAEDFHQEMRMEIAEHMIGEKGEDLTSSSLEILD